MLLFPTLVWLWRDRRGAFNRVQRTSWSAASMESVLASRYEERAALAAVTHMKGRAALAKVKGKATETSG